jgi:2-polyprenyl-3-methyl-5-hydroxy-6-metoxy-1,4-benzoquinol methylase
MKAPLPSFWWSWVSSTFYGQFLLTVRQRLTPTERHNGARANEKETSRKYTKEQIESILREEDFEYHRVNLPYGLCTSGMDRSPTSDLIFPESLVGKTVLDVGCGLGVFCFDAEARQASRVVGLELKDSRLRKAFLLKDILDSKVEFQQRDILCHPLKETFDYVLLLNVIHHLKTPQQFLRQLASITRERLIIEFPTFADPKFKKLIGSIFPFWYNRLPLIGVSSLSKADQTFVFTPSAIKAILLEHEHLFSRVDIIKSPLRGRALAVCHKK